MWAFENLSTTRVSPKDSFQANYSKLIDVATTVYQTYNDVHFYCHLALEEMAYYATALLHLKLIEIKAKQGITDLTEAEWDIRRYAVNEFNIPQPLFIYLQEIGTYDESGYETQLDIPALPVTVVHNFGGYHAAAVTEHTHNLFEEVPSLGIAGDMLMVLASPDVQAKPNFHIERPLNTVFTDNLIGKFDLSIYRSIEVRQRLNFYNITANSFQECVPNTRFNLPYIRALSDVIGQFKTFEIKKVKFCELNTKGEVTQLVKTKPIEPSEKDNWRARSVMPVSVSKAIRSDAYCFGFQLYKEDSYGVDRNETTANWSCIVGTGNEPWLMPDPWYANRNARRDLPPFFNIERFKTISQRQNCMLMNFVQRLQKN